MRFDLLTIFPDFFNGPFDFGIIRRARQEGLIEIVIHDLRSFTSDKHHVVDDRPFGGGDGMVLKPEPIFQAVETLLAEQTEETKENVAIVLLSPQGRLFDQARAAAFASACSRMILICGRYEGVDERVAERLVTDELSIGDYVLTGGEIPAMAIVDAVTRLLPKALGSETSAVNDSFASSGLLDYPHYTRPADFRGWRAPDVLISGHHAEVAKWRRRAALLKTLRMRPDLLAHAELNEEERRWLSETES